MYPKLALSAFLTLIPMLLMAQLEGPQIPDSLSVQGLLTDDTGTLLSDGNYDLDFKLYDGPTNVWQETHLNVPVVSGVFNVILGGTASLRSLPFRRPLELGIAVEGDLEMIPRTPLTSAAYALAVRGFYAVDTTLTQEGYINSAPNLIGGASNNFVSDAVGATIGGGGGIYDEFSEVPNSVTGSWGTVSGGRSNTADESGVVGGGENNTAGEQAFVGGGYFNTTSFQSAIGAGASNEAYSGGFVGAGINNYAFSASAVGAGQNNRASNYSFIGSGGENRATSLYSVVPGGYGNRATDQWTFAAGRWARANHPGSFVWSGSGTAADTFATTGSGQFLIRASGGVGIGANNPLADLHILTNDQDVTSGALLGEEILVESSDAILGLYSGEGGNWGSGVVLAEMGPDLVANTLKSKWAMVRNTNTGGNYLRFTYGTDNDWSANDTQMRIESNGDVRADGSFLGGGADVAEAVDPAGPKSEYDPGDVLVVSTKSDRTFERSSAAYSTTVAGVYATRPGVVLHNTGIDGDLTGKVPLTVVGIVPTKVTAENGPIRRGDLLVTSSTEGHAMKASPTAVNGIEIFPTGTILGKALADFDGPGSGVIEVLVNVK